jgi:C1A family cysteine protease
MNTLNSSKLLLVLIVSLLPIKSVFADEIDIIGSKEQALQEHGKQSIASAKGALPKKIIQLLKVKLSTETKSRLQREVKEMNAPLAAKHTSLGLPRSKQLGMSNVPVLDQGRHGTCATFAITAAIDARLGKGDYISQLCYLQLGNYLAKNGQQKYSGWDGEYPINIINNITQYGVVNKSNQQTKGCGGLTQYPTDNKQTPASFMEPTKYQAMSEMVFGTVINWDEISRVNSETKLDDVKEALNAGDRIVFGVLLPRVDLGTVGAVGRHKNWLFEDTWVLTPEVKKGLDNIDSGHAMIITGYDDDAVATDDHGNKHTGLLKLRNSWGTYAGDYGEFYMSYDYFKLLAIDVKKFY